MGHLVIETILVNISQLYMALAVFLFVCNHDKQSVESGSVPQTSSIIYSCQAQGHRTQPSLFDIYLCMKTRVHVYINNVSSAPGIFPLSFTTA